MCVCTGIIEVGALTAIVGALTRYKRKKKNEKTKN